MVSVSIIEGHVWYALKRVLYVLDAIQLDFEEKTTNLDSVRRKKIKQLEEEYAAIRERLEIACQMGDLTEYPKVVILAMSRKVIEHLAAKYEKVAKGVSQQMGGKVLNYEAKDILNRGRAEGRTEGEAAGIKKVQSAVKLLKNGKSITEVAFHTELPQETVAEVAQSISTVVK